MTMSDAAVEAAAWALHSDGCPDDECDGGCGGFRREAEVAVRAALPHLLALIRETHRLCTICDCSCCQSCEFVYPCQTIRICNALEGKTND